jgi:hypothetical protein
VLRSVRGSRARLARARGRAVARAGDRAATRAWAVGSDRWWESEVTTKRQATTIFRRMRERRTEETDADQYKGVGAMNLDAYPVTGVCHNDAT